MDGCTYPQVRRQSEEVGLRTPQTRLDYGSILPKYRIGAVAEQSSLSTISAVSRKSARNKRPKTVGRRRRVARYVALHVCMYGV